MKKRFMIIFMLLLLVLPLSGCPNDEKEMVDVTVEVEKAEEADYKINDCAKVYGAGKYEKGSQVTIGIDVVREACALDHYEKDGTMGESSKLTIIVNQPTRIVFYVKNYSGQSQGKATLYFDGVYMRKIDQGTPTTTQLNVNDYTFPKLSDGSGISVEKVNGEMKKSFSVGNGGKSLNEILTEEKVDLNYLYLNNTFQPYKLKWSVGTYTNMTCNYNANNAYIDPNSYNAYSLQNGYTTCVMATIDTTKEDDVSRDQSLTNLLSSSTYITTSNASGANSCLGASSANASVSSDCMFVSNIKNMINNNTGYVEYYGITDNNRLEAVLTTNANNQLKYYICEVPGNCSEENTFKVDYSTNNYEMLKIGEFIKGLFETGTEGINFAKFSQGLQIEKYDYSSKVKGIVPKQIKIDGKTYYINIIDFDKISALYTNAAQLKVNVNAPDANMYNFDFAFDDSILEPERERLNVIIDKLKAKLFADNFNLIYKTSGGEFAENVGKTIYKVITQNSDVDTDLKALRNYIYNASGQNNTITVTLKSAIIDRSIYDDTIFIKDNNGEVYHREASSITSEYLRNYIDTNLTKENGLSELEIVNIKEDINRKTITYEFENGQIIEYSSEDKKFELFTKTDTSNKQTLELLEANEDDFKDNIQNIIYELNTVIGTLTQTLHYHEFSNENDSIETKLGTQNVEDLGLEVEVNKTTIMNIYNLLKAETTKIYKITGEDVNKYFVCDGEKNVYVISKTNTDGSDKYILEYNSESFELTLTPEE